MIARGTVEVGQLLTKSRVAAILGICVRGVERLITAGKLVKVTVGRRAVRIPEWSVGEYQREIGCDPTRLQT